MQLSTLLNDEIATAALAGEITLTAARAELRRRDSSTARKALKRLVNGRKASAPVLVVDNARLTPRKARRGDPDRQLAWQVALGECAELGLEMRGPNGGYSSHVWASYQAIRRAQRICA